MNVISYKNNISDNTYKSIIWKAALIFTIILELVLIYLFAVKSMGLLGIVLIVGMALAIAVFLDPRIGALLIIGLVYSNFGSLIGGSIFSALLMLVLSSLIIRKLIDSPEFIKHKVNLFISIFTLFMIISLIIVDVHELAIEIFIAYLKCLIMYFCVSNLINSKKYLVFSYITIITASVILALYAIHSFFNNAELSMRIEGVTRDPNDLAIVLLTAVPLTISLLKINKNYIFKLFFLMCGIVLTIIIFMTYSRGAMIAMFFVLFWLVYNERKNKIVMLLFIISFMALLYFFVTEFANYKDLLHLVSKDSSFLQRLKLYKGGIQMFLDNPFLGVGLGNFIVWSTRFSGLVASLHAHNTFLHVGAELGIGGLISFCLIVIYTWLTVHRSQKIAMNRNDNSLIVLAIGLKISFSAFLVAGMFLSSQFNTVFWVLLGICIAFEQVVIKEKVNNSIEKA